MARPEDETEFDSACEDEYPGGVSLVELDDIMPEIEAQPKPPDNAYGTLEESFPSTADDGGEVNTSLELVNGLPEQDLSALDSTQVFIPEEPPNHSLEATASGWPDTEMNLYDFFAGSNGVPSTASELPTASNDTPDFSTNEVLVPVDSGPAAFAMDDDLASTHDGMDSVLSSPFEDANMLEAGSYPAYASLLDWDANQHSQFVHNFSSPSEATSNMSFVDCLYWWQVSDAILQVESLHRPHLRPPSLPSFKDSDIPLWKSWRHRKITAKVIHSDVYGGLCKDVAVKPAVDNHVQNDGCDYQGINWKLCGTPGRDMREDMQRVRRQTYFNHVNMLQFPQSFPAVRALNNWSMFCSAPYMNQEGRKRATEILDAEKEQYFRFNRMNLDTKISIPHFQLRHIISASSKNAVFYPTVANTNETGSQITSFNTDVEVNSEIIDSANSGRHSDVIRMQKIYTLSAKHDVLIAGGLHGEYAMKSLTTTPQGPFTSGMVTESHESSTNHVHTYLDRRSGLPQAVFSSNDRHTHTLDCATNTFVSHHNHGKRVNCTATSPDTRLRLLARDAKHPIIVEADTGKRIARLPGHSDYSFACDWSDDGVHVATGAQDGLVQIYDLRSWHQPLETLAPDVLRKPARNWRQPIQTLAADLGGVRTLCFSPQGSGPPVLVLAESADYVHVVDAVGFGRKQTISLFGEVAGVSFDPEGQKFWVGVGDPDVGGLMEFERNTGGRFRRRRGKAVSRWEDDLDGLYW